MNKSQDKVTFLKKKKKGKKSRPVNWEGSYCKDGLLSWDCSWERGVPWGFRSGHSFLRRKRGDHLIIHNPKRLATSFPSLQRNCTAESSWTVLFSPWWWTIKYLYNCRADVQPARPIQQDWPQHWPTVCFHLSQAFSSPNCVPTFLHCRDGSNRWIWSCPSAAASPSVVPYYLWSRTQTL